MKSSIYLRKNLKNFLDQGIITLLSILLFAFPIQSIVSKPIINADQISKGQVIGKSIEILEDPSGEWKIIDVTQAENENLWKIGTKDIPNFGFSNSAFWVRFQFYSNDLYHPLFLEYGYPPMDLIDVYAVDKLGKVVFHKQSGDSVSYLNRDILFRNSIFDLDMGNREIDSYYIRFSSTSSMNLDLRIWHLSSLIEKIDIEQGYLHIYFGILFGLMIFNLFLFVMVKDFNYLLYTAFIFASFFLDYTLLGNTYRIFSPDVSILVNRHIPLYLNLANLTALLFSRNFLNTSLRMKYADWVLIFLSTIAGILCIYSIFGEYGQAISISMPFSFVAYLSLGVIGLIGYFRGYKAAKFYLIGFSILIVSSITIVLKTVGILPVNVFTNYAMYIGRASNALFLAIALADRINELKKEREMALTSKLRESEKLGILGKTFRKFVPFKFLEYLGLDDITKIKLGDSVEIEMTVLFADIRSFTTLSEKMAPAENFKFLNDFLNLIEPIFSKNYGYVDKYLGDGVMALFHRTPGDAIKSAVEANRVLRAYNLGRASSGLDPINIGIGINTGRLMLGTIGTENRMEITVISDAVNLAARMEGLTK
ncbi:MAG: hypothetical protein JJT78_17070 [Leptospira sp.]|nr:hypothetical protein [Leptospira sp.]